MKQNKLNKQSIYLTLGIIIISTVVVIMSLHSAYTYVNTKQTITNEIKQTATRSIASLERSIIGLIESYSVHEYENLVAAEMESRSIYAIVIEDYNMGKIIGKKSFITGKIRDTENRIVDYDPVDTEQDRRIDTSFFSDSKILLNSSGVQVGVIRVYLSPEHLNQELSKITTQTVINTVE
ncbi:MAG: hypothetical protein ABW153_17290, partial [Sedimenticola sp.]